MVCHKLFGPQVCPTVVRRGLEDVRRAILQVSSGSMGMPMDQQAFRVGECVTTPRGFVGEITELGLDCAVIRYLGKQRHLGEMEMKLAFLRPATAHDLALAGIRGGDPSAPKPWTSSVAVAETRSRRNPQRSEHDAWRVKRIGSASGVPGVGLHELVADLMKESREESQCAPAATASTPGARRA